jgi:hypothetical protein
LPVISPPGWPGPGLAGARRSGRRARAGAGGRRAGADNFKTGVDRPDLYDPKINRSYAELAAHYGF